MVAFLKKFGFGSIAVSILVTAVKWINRAGMFQTLTDMIHGLPWFVQNLLVVITAIWFWPVLSIVCFVAWSAITMMTPKAHFTPFLAMIVNEGAKGHYAFDIAVENTGSVAAKEITATGFACDTDMTGDVRIMPTSTSHDVDPEQKRSFAIGFSRRDGKLKPLFVVITIRYKPSKWLRRKRQRFHYRCDLGDKENTFRRQLIPTTSEEAKKIEDWLTTEFEKAGFIEI